MAKNLVAKQNLNRNLDVVTDFPITVPATLPNKIGVGLNVSLADYQDPTFSFRVTVKWFRDGAWTTWVGFQADGDPGHDRPPAIEVGTNQLVAGEGLRVDIQKTIGWNSTVIIWDTDLATVGRDDADHSEWLNL